MAKQFAVLGSPIEHSKSPQIHTAAYRVLADDWSYSRAEVAKGRLREFIEHADVNFSGFSVTMPLKEEAFRFALVHDEISELTKSVNTLTRDSQGTWFGFNTDVYGIIKAVEPKLLQTPSRELIIGSGATAYSAMVALHSLAPESLVYVHARNRKTRNGLVKFGRELGLHVKSAYFLDRAVSKADLTISTVPAHALDTYFNRALSRSSFKPGGPLLDVAYAAWPSVPARFWQSRGLEAVNGLEMLLWQAIAQIRIFKFGNPALTLPNEKAAFDAMRAAIE